MSAQPALDESDLIAELNGFRREGRQLDNIFRINSIQRRIEIFKKQDIVAYWLHMSALHCLCGKIDDALHACKIAEQMAYSADHTSYELVTLLYSGERHVARELLERLSDEQIVEFLGRGIYHLVDAACYSRLKRMGAAMPSVNEMTQYLLRFGNEASHILERSNVEEVVVLDMLKLATELLREKRLLQTQDTRLFSYPADGTISLQIPVNVTPEAAAELGWEYAMRLFQSMPNAPATVVHIGFTTEEASSHGE